MSSGGRMTHAEYGDAAYRDAQYNAALVGGAWGATTGLGLAAPAAVFLHRSSTSFRGLSLPVKTLFVVMATAAGGVWNADKAGLKFERSHFRDKGAQVVRRRASAEEDAWEHLSRSDRALTWAKDNKFAVVAGSWFASMGLSGAYIQSQPLSFAQKLVQARVFAQGFTLVSLLAMAAITQIPTEGDRILDARDKKGEHSWKDFIDESDGGNKHGQKA
ncbi:hypothetical protein IE81DRAFT_321369 [Ceraceosorus guamensis]|uniref:HIG1 domain-containing protein n=1 Tax=Ceraceosorus guamensis TaxID=1522189 RepID=A0A316W420_9BASI|nr:hypothetical protein IE81DRAFT_321369 [Ceraceosorus guamensis]PWN44469.1 hypothetical protein IE81DRAFT_321369 [Ceraceosorus guamensis]